MTLREQEAAAIDELPQDLNEGDRVTVSLIGLESWCDVDGGRTLTVESAEDVPEWVRPGLMQSPGGTFYTLSGYGTAYFAYETTLLSGKRPRTWLSWKSNPHGGQIHSIEVEERA